MHRVLFESSLIAALTIACFVVTGLGADRGRGALTAPAVIALLAVAFADGRGCGQGRRGKQHADQSRQQRLQKLDSQEGQRQVRSITFQLGIFDTLSLSWLASVAYIDIVA